MKLRSFISRLEEFGACLVEFPSDTEGQETTPLPVDGSIASYMESAIILQINTRIHVL